jgi:uncharacterized metal-binding protein YceD (DUF177 family)
MGAPPPPTPPPGEAVCLKKLNEVEGKEQYHVEISNRFAALENLDTEMDINRV